jgi:hypothetical protein
VQATIFNQLSKDGAPFTANDVIAIDEDETLVHWVPSVGTRYRIWQGTASGLQGIAVGFAGVPSDKMHIAVTNGTQYLVFDAHPGWWQGL